MSDFTVQQRGTDTSGRPLFATAYMWTWWDRVCAELGFTPTIVQAAFMTRAGGGATASAGYHDAGGCLDLRVWDITEDQVGKTIRTLRRYGAAAWVRDQRHGMDPHIHFVLGTDRPLADGAAWQWQQYLNGGDGLASGGRDYHWRPDPIVTTPPEDIMATKQELAELLDDKLAPIRKMLAGSREREVQIRKRAIDIEHQLEELEQTGATKDQVRRLRGDVAGVRDLVDAADEVTPGG